MEINSKAEVLEILQMPYEKYLEEIASVAKQVHIKTNRNVLKATAMLGYDNICKNQCLYCGMRAGNKEIERYRIIKEDIIASATVAAETGFKRIFLISGEDPKYGFDNLTFIVEALKKLGFFISLACGEFSREQYKELYSAGANEYVLKFEMSQADVFNRMKPSTDFLKRMRGMAWIKESGMSLASGNIVDYPGQTDEQLAEDILLTRDLNVSWAPIIPYLPAKGTPLAQEGNRGSLEKNLKEISMLRIMLPKANITAQQPGEDMTKGLADPEGNLNALNAGGNMLFADMLPSSLAKNFSVIDNRITLGLEHIKKMSEISQMPMEF